MKKDNQKELLPPKELHYINGLTVVDSSAYNVYQSFSDNYWVNIGRYFKSDEDKSLNVDLLSKLTKIKKNIAHLSKSEQNRALCYYFIVNKAYLFLNKLAENATSKTRKNKLNIDNISGHIILQNRRAEILDLFGKMYTVDEVYKIITTEWEIDIYISELERFRQDNNEKIIELQKQFTNNFNEVRLAHKHSRLLEYMFLYNDTKESYNMSRDKNDRKFLKELLESIKKEVEGDIININGQININIEQTLNIYIQKNMLQKLPLNEMILSRVATKTGVNPFLLLYRLQKSYYSKFAGFTPTHESQIPELPEYPSSVTYDLEKLVQLNETRKQEANKNREFFDNFIEIKETPNAQSIKEKLMSKILQHKEDLNKK